MTAAPTHYDPVSSRALIAAPAVRAVAAVAVVALTTFVQNRTVLFDALAFGLLALATAVSFVIVSLADRRMRPTSIAIAVLSVIAAVAAAALPHETMGPLLMTVAAWGVLTGLIEIVGGVIGRGRYPQARESLVAGAITALFGIAAAIIPPELDSAYHGQDVSIGSMTAPVMLAGLLGIACALLGAYLAIAAVSVVLARRATAETLEASGADGATSLPAGTLEEQ